MVTTTAGADTNTCYTGCSAPSTGLPNTSGDGLAGPTPSSAPSSTSSLAFTGADLSELVAVSVGALGAGTLLVRHSRRRQSGRTLLSLPAAPAATHPGCLLGVGPRGVSKYKDRATGSLVQFQGPFDPQPSTRAAGCAR